MQTEFFYQNSFIILGIIAFVVITALGFATKSFLSFQTKEEEQDETYDVLPLVAYLPIILLVGFAVWTWADSYGMTGHIIEWLNLLVRWFHVIIGIAWIGASFYFIFLENSLNRRTKDLRDELAGNLWAVHGGGFYYIEKYKTAPKILPEVLHWFKWESYLTWFSGIGLLGIVYYSNASAYMIDSNVADISPTTAIIIGITTLVGGWLIYDVMSTSKLVENKPLFTLIGFLLVVVVAFVLSHLLSARAAYIHVGAMLGTIMTGNVFKGIIPAQKAMVKAATEKTYLDPTLGQKAGQRSLHNNYLTLPVVFIMISNHFPSTFGNEYNWLVLTGLFATSGLLRHYINLHEQGQKAAWILPLVTLGILTLAFVTAPIQKKSGSEMGEINFLEVAPIIKNRCASCHSATPTDDVWAVAPNGVKFDTPQEIQKRADLIMTRAVSTTSMPQANKTKMTQEERNILGTWIRQGAKIE